jgi:hypothetical protein
VIQRNARATVWLLIMMWLIACGSSGVGQTPAPSPAASANPATPAVLGSGPLHVTFTAPADNTVVNVPRVAVTGLAPSETVLTINDSLIVVDATGQFSVTVPLQEGPNELNVLASDSDGNLVSTQLIVTYDPAQ